MKKIIFYAVVVMVGVVSMYSEARAELINDNVVLNAYRQAEENSSNLVKMRDGVVDAFVDKCGFSESSSTNLDYVKTLIAGEEDIIIAYAFEGFEGEKLVTDFSGECHHNPTFNGDAHISTDQSKFGDASLELDGTGDYLSLPDDDDWDLAASSSDDWTIDFFVKCVILLIS